MSEEQTFALPVPTFFRRPLEKVTGVSELRKIYLNAKNSNEGRNFYEKILKTMNVNVQTDRHELIKIPKKGACIVVANHPFGCVEGVAMAHTLLSVRDDVKILANGFLSLIPEFHDSMYFVNPFGTKASRVQNSKSLRNALYWLQNGGMLVVFPAGEVSSLSLKTLKIQDKEWNSSIAKLALKTKATVIPAFIPGNNTALFYTAGLVHSRLRTALLINEFLKRKDTTLTITFGKGIQIAQNEERNADELIKYYRYRSHILAYKNKEIFRDNICELFQGFEIAEPVDRKILEVEIESLHHAYLFQQGDYVVYSADYSAMPNVMNEIGRLRELSFRLVGEGTGNKYDIDEFDNHYTHLFIWNSVEKEIVGAYRIGKVDEIVEKHGIKGLYSASLFQYHSEFISHFPNSLEMGRSFVHPEYQKSYFPMLLLWKGIASFVAKNPRYHLLFGPVSISSSFSDLSLALIVDTLRKHHCFSSIENLVQAKDDEIIQTVFEKFETVLNETEVDSIEELNDIVSDIESDGKGIPVLVRQYVRLGGKLVTFSIDKSFNNCCDGLIIVDLLKTDRQVLGKYMGGDTEGYLHYHGVNTVGTELPEEMMEVS